MAQDDISTQTLIALVNLKYVMETYDDVEVDPARGLVRYRDGTSVEFLTLQQLVDRELYPTAITDYNVTVTASLAAINDMATNAQATLDEEEIV